MSTRVTSQEKPAQISGPGSAPSLNAWPSTGGLTQPSLGFPMGKDVLFILKPGQLSHKDNKFLLSS